MRKLSNSWMLAWAAAFVGGFAVNVATGQVAAEAVSGSPFGVGQVTVRLSEGAARGLSGADAFTLTEKNGRLLYPASGGGLVARLADKSDDPRRLAIWFLFRGNGPLELTLSCPMPRTFTLTPGDRLRQHDRLLRQWWRQYNAAAQVAADRGQHPSVTDYYLVAMLARRLGLQPTLAGRKLFDNRSDDRGLGLLLGSHSLRVHLASEMMFGRDAERQTADQPLDAGPPLPATSPAVPGDVDIEAISLRVPPECFYVRFGSFANYRWLRSLLADYGGDVMNLVAPQGIDGGLNGKLERQLALRDTTLGNLLGGQVIDDVALIGTDTFFREGAAVGMLFKARSNLLLSRAIAQQRSEARAADPRVRESQVKLAGQDVSFLSTQDESVRSLYVARGDYHFVTSSSRLARRFLELDEKESLGASPLFRHARSVLPTRRGDTVFAYLSEGFFRNLASPAYRIEMARRLRSLTEMDLAQMARLAARAEGHSDAGTARLVELGLLPPGFGRRADGSRLDVTADGTLLDSRRGGRGSFLPVPDVEVSAATPQELAEYRQFRVAYDELVGRLEPVLIGLKREATDKPGVERVQIDGFISPFRGRVYEQVASRVGPPTQTMIAPVSGDLVSVQAILRGSDFLGIAASEHRHLFAGLGDFRRPVRLESLGLLELLKLGREMNGYVGSWPETGVLGKLFGFQGEVPPGEIIHVDFLGQLGLWITKVAQFTVLSVNRDDLTRTAKELRTVEAPYPAQIRVTASDLSGTNLAEVISALGYQQARSRSMANAQFMHHLAAQFQAPRDHCRELAESLAGGQLVCPLGGQYELTVRDGLKSWTSTAWSAGPPASEGRASPKAYIAPPLRWLRGFNAHATLDADRLSIHAVVLIQTAKARQQR